MMIMAKGYDTMTRRSHGNLRQSIAAWHPVCSKQNTQQASIEAFGLGAGLGRFQVWHDRRERQRGHRRSPRPCWPGPEAAHTAPVNRADGCGGISWSNFSGACIKEQPRVVVLLDRRRAFNQLLETVTSSSSLTMYEKWVGVV